LITMNDRFFFVIINATQNDANNLFSDISAPDYHKYQVSCMSPENMPYKV